MLDLAVALGILGLATLLAWRAWASWLKLLVVFLPLYVVRFALPFPLIGELPTTLLELWVGGGLLVWLFGLAPVSVIDTVKSWRHWKQDAYLMLQLAVLAAGLLAVGFSPHTVAALGIWRAYFLEPILLAVVLRPLLAEQRYQQAFLRGLTALTLWIGGLALMQYLVGFGLHVGFDETGRGRALAVFNTPNAVGLLLAPLAAFWLGRLLSGQKTADTSWRNQPWTVLAMLLGTAGVWVSFSRGAWLGMLAAVAMLAFWRLPRKLFAGVALGLGAVVVVAFLTVPRLQAFYQPSANQDDLFGDNSANVRMIIWERGWSLITQHPLTGTGLAGFQTAYASFDVPAHQEIPLYPHNLLLNFWTELGGLGVLVFGTLLFWLFWQLLRRLRYVNPLDTSALPLLAYMTAWGVHGLVDVPYFKNDLSMLFWLLLTWYVATAQTSGSEPGPILDKA